jgi:hypothetical protein
MLSKFVIALYAVAYLAIIFIIQSQRDNRLTRKNNVYMWHRRRNYGCIDFI